MTDQKTDRSGHRVVALSNNVILGTKDIGYKIYKRMRWTPLQTPCDPGGDQCWPDPPPSPPCSPSSTPPPSRSFGPSDFASIH